MNRLRLRQSMMVVILLFISANVVSNAQTKAAAKPVASVGANKREIIRKARAAYYNLANHGFVEFQANADPNWGLILEEVVTKDPTVMKMLNGIRFTLTYDSHGKAQLTHREEVAVPSEKAAALKQIYGALEQQSAFAFSTWSMFMLYSPLPAETDDFKLEDVNGQYRISFEAGSTNIAIMMSKDYAISEMKTSSQGINSVLNPKIRKTSQGFILAGYVATRTAGNSTEKTNVQMEYVEVDGLQLLSKLTLDGTLQPAAAGGGFGMGMTFNQYKVKKK